MEKSATFRFSNLLDRADKLLSQFRAAGIIVNPSSRFSRYAKELKVAAESEYDTPPDAVLRVWHRLLIEVDNLDTVLGNLSAEPAVGGWQGKVQETLSGGVLRTQDRTDCRARNIQFELLVASLIRRAGYAVQLRDPDVVLKLETSEIGIAVKRPRSPTKITTHIGVGQRQLKKAGLTGLVAIDLTILENASDKHLTTSNFGKTEAALIQRFSDITGYVRSVEARAIDTAVVFGLITHLAIPVWEPEERAISFIERWSVAPLVGEADPRHRILRALHDRVGGLL
ncbi:MAG TPA: hypothetical protein VGQ65_20270 [Thermoanaerobaculia bacterium]|jgi:hypothetical protein|nr:hypothetical protein [Thermoanaerobaculia bacterium]